MISTKTLTRKDTDGGPTLNKLTTPGKVYRVWGYYGPTYSIRDDRGGFFLVTYNRLKHFTEGGRR